VDGAVNVSCAPASESTFPLRTTAVTCPAADAHGSTAHGSFKVTVNYRCVGKTGTNSAGCSGSTRARQVGWENCQRGVSCAYITGTGALIECELYLPKSWTADRDDSRETAVPDHVEFATKTELARAMLARLRMSAFRAMGDHR
jgi:hypothetical protein